jgi:hypothetical protein
MEISRAQDTSVRIKTKDLSIIVDPSEKFEEDVVLLTAPNSDLSKYKEKLVFYGPGEYESKGVSIKCERIKDGLVYEIVEDSRKVLVGTTDSLSEIKESEGYNAVIIFAKEKIDDALLSGLSSELIIVYGESSNIALSPETIKKTEKLNLKKAEEFKGLITYLGK